MPHADPRQTLILTQDIADDQLIDSHPKPGTRLRKLVDKKVIDALYLNNIPVSVGDTSKRIDALLFDKPHAVGPTDIGILTDRKHQVFRAGTDDAFIDVMGGEVVVDLLFTASLNFSIGLTTGSATGLTVGDPGDVQVGDLVRVQGQGTVAPYITTVIAKTPSGPNFLLTFQVPFIQGPSQTYTMERMARWEVIFKDSSNNPFSMPGTTVDLGIFQRVFLADILESFGHGPFKHPELAPEAGLGVALPPGAPFSSSTIEVILEPSESFLWFHGLNTDIPLLTWWVEFPCYPVERIFFGLQPTTSFLMESHVHCPPTLGGTLPVKFRLVDENTIEIVNENTVQHRVKAVAFKTATS
jgi:hypothetical protein